MKDKLNFGLVGYKFMGKAHSNALQRIGMFFNPSVKIGMKAICGRDESWVRESAEKFGWESYETSCMNIPLFTNSMSLLNA